MSPADCRFVHLPAWGRGIKCVQVELDAVLYTVLCRKEPRQEFHSQILEDFLKEQGIEPTFVPSPRNSERLLPALVGERYRVLGMGRVDIYGTPRKIEFGETSYDYCIGIDAEGAKRACAALQALDR